ncbi:hypothetical protein OH76DRAFT_1487217 [Lentinus brumalis]|uniref:Uncharacterized protein n=1 Tax=Lentinus brumalis TaxID=2498619 RepID=A0A371CVF1_9APHY|nr:hypothetical protein OH76DRAFT_1487217 [Polyporus brumalis]
MSNPSSATPPRFLGGVMPGMLDPSQPSRILIHPSASLHFATFDPLTGRGQGNPAVDAPAVGFPKRIVVESVPGVGNRWCFVPAARLAPGVWSEGIFPRFVMICGDLVICSQEQWDIHKLDPLYDCYVPAHPNIPMITRYGPAPAESISTVGRRKRRARSPVSEADSPPKPARKYRKTGPKAEEPASNASTTTAYTMSESSTADTVTPSVSHPPKSAKSKGKQKATVEDDDEVTSIPASWFTDFAHEGSASASTTTSTPFPSASGMPGKEQAPSVATSSTSAMSIVDEGSFVHNSAPLDSSASGAAGAPFPETVHPGAPFQEALHPNASSSRGGFTPHKQKLTRDPSIIDLTMEDAFEDYTPTPRDNPIPKRTASDDSEGDSPYHPNKRARTQPAPPYDKKAAERHRERRKTQERDRAEVKVKEQERRQQQIWEDILGSSSSIPLLDARERLRASRAAAAAAEAAREASDPIYRANAERLRAEAAAKAEAEHRERERRERREDERQKRRALASSRWAVGPWTEERAILRYITLCEEFDALQFGEDVPADFEIIPWPILTNPSWLRPADISWQAVENFFSAARLRMESHHYKDFVTASHFRFHPDRWLSRNILKWVDDDDARQDMQQAVLACAQALTPIWRNARSM